MADFDKIKDRIRKLQIQSVGEGDIGNSAAAETFAQKANELLLKYHLSQSDIDAHEGETNARGEAIVSVVVNPAVYGIKPKKTRVRWQEDLARIIAQAHFCRHLVYSGCNYMKFVGTESCVSTAVHIYATLVPLVEKLAKQEYEKFYTALERQAKKDGAWEHRAQYTKQARGFRGSWLTAFTGRLRERFDENRRKAVEGSSTALVVIRDTLARVDEHLEGKTVKLAGLKLGNRSNEFGTQWGRRAADRVNLGQRQVNQ